MAGAIFQDVEIEGVLRVRGIDVPTIATQGSAAFYGTGFDGPLAFDGSNVLGIAPVGNVYTLTRSIFATTITIAPGFTIDPDGYYIYASVSILGTSGGTTPRIAYLANSGAAGAGNVGGAGGAARAAARPLPGSLVAGGVGGGSGGGAGGAGVDVTNVPFPAATVGTTPSGAVPGTLQGGAGGKSSGGTNGGVGGAVTVQLVTTGNSILTVPQCITFNSITTATFTGQQRMNTGSSGGGGRGGDGAGSGAGGGGGAPGGTVFVASPIIGGSLSLEANGGNGGRAQVAAADGAGGGGGAGGVLIILTQSLAATVAKSANGGTGGASNPAPAINGANGGPGIIVQLAA